MSEKTVCTTCKQILSEDNFTPLPGFEDVCDSCYSEMDFEMLHSRMVSPSPAPALIDEDFKLVNKLIESVYFDEYVHIDRHHIAVKIHNERITEEILEEILTSISHKYYIIKSKGAIQFDRKLLSDGTEPSTFKVINDINSQSNE